jgi:hypothetical protein
LPSPVTVKIKVKPYIRKYLIAKSINKAEPIIFDSRNEYGHFLIGLLTNYYHQTSFPITEKENVYAYFNRGRPNCEFLEIRLPFNRKKNILYTNYLPKHHQQIFINEITADFYQELNRFFKHNLDKGIQRKDILHYFISQYNISEDDLKFESIYRQSSRMLECKSRKFYQILRHISGDFVL